MDPAFLANHLREEIDRAVNGKSRAKREAERWASLTDEQKALEKKENFFNDIAFVLFFIGIFMFFLSSVKESPIRPSYGFPVISLGLLVFLLPMNNWGCFSIALIIFLLSLFSLYYF